MNYRRLLLLIMLVGGIFAAGAQGAYTVLNLNSNQITYHNKPCKPGMKIDKLQDIKWGSMDNALVIRDTTGRQTVLSPRMQKRANGESTLVTNIRLSTRGDWDVKELSEILRDVRIFDEWHGYTSFATTDPGRYVFIYETSDGPKDVVLDKPSDYEFVFTRDMFGDEASGSIKGKLERVDAQGEALVMCDDVNIRFLKGIK